MRPLRRPDVLVIIALGLLLTLFAVLRQEFIGDGIRHLPTALETNRPTFGTPRWLLFPVLTWLIVHLLPGAAFNGAIETAIRALLALSVASGITYLAGLNWWLRAERHDAAARAAALLGAGATMPFLVLYSDVAEAQLPAAMAVTALAVCRVRFASGRGGDGTILFTVATIAVASLIYQAVVLSLVFLPLVAPLERFPRRTVAIGIALITLCIPAILIAARMAAGDPVSVALLTTFRGERGDLVRASLTSATPMKWAAALLAGPPQAIVGLWKFQGLPLLARGVVIRDADAFANAARLSLGLGIVGLLAWAAVRTRDWRIAVAALGVVALPILRNQQYTYVKFYLLWPAVVALAMTKLRLRHASAIAIIIVVLNSWLVARTVVEGRGRRADAQTAYVKATASDCYFTMDWGPPFWHTWPGSSAAIISIFWAADEQAAGEQDRVTPAVRDCFCRATSVWTDATVEAGGDVLRLTNQFGYAGLPLSDFLYRREDGFALPTSVTPMFVFSPARQAELCAKARSAG